MAINENKSIKDNKKLILVLTLQKIHIYAIIRKISKIK